MLIKKMFSKLFARMAHIMNILKNPKCRGFDILADEKNLRHFNSPRQQLFSSFGLEYGDNLPPPHPIITTEI